MITPTFISQLCGLAHGTALLTGHLIKQGVKIEVVTTDNEEIKNTNYSQNDFAVLPVMRNWKWSALKTFKNLIVSQKPDIIDIQYISAGYSRRHPMISFLPMFIKLWRLDCKSVVTFHELSPPKLFPNCSQLINFPFAILFTMSLLIFSDRIIICAEWIEWEFQSKIPSFIFRKFIKPKMYFVPVASNITVFPENKDRILYFRKKYSLAEDNFIISFFGFIREEKDLETLFFAFQDILKKRCKCRLFVIGAVLDKNFYARIKKLEYELGLSQYVVWTQFLSPEDVSACLRIPDICVLPFKKRSIFNRGGLSLNHGSFHAAACHGLPIIANPGKMIPFGLINGENILLIPAGDRYKLGEAILKLYSSPKLRKTMGDRIGKFSKSFTWEQRARRTKAVYNSLFSHTDNISQRHSAIAKI